MLRLVAGHLRSSWGRALTLLLTVMVATASFSLLSNSVGTTRLRVLGTVSESFRSTYDLLVRPVADRSAIEERSGSVRPNYQSGIFGGITSAQLATIRSLPGVEIAAPTGNIGYVVLPGRLDIDLDPFLDGSAQQLFRVTPTWSMDNGLTRIVGSPVYVYFSRNPVAPAGPTPTTRNAPSAAGTATVVEMLPDGRSMSACRNVSIDQEATVRSDSADHASPFTAQDPYRTSFTCVYTQVDDNEQAHPGITNAAQGVHAIIYLNIPVLLTAIDPDAEQALAGLRSAVVSGRALTADDAAKETTLGQAIPVLSSSLPAIGAEVAAQVSRVAASGRQLSDTLSSNDGVVGRLQALPATGVGSSATLTASHVYATALSTGYSSVMRYWRVGSTAYSGTSPLMVDSVTLSQDAYAKKGSVTAEVPEGGADRAVRDISSYTFNLTDTSLPPIVSVVGTFDPSKLVGNSTTSGLGSSDYQATPLSGADAASEAALGSAPWLASSNLGGYPAQPPSLLTTFAGAAPLLSSKDYPGASSEAPISVVRVRVAGVIGTDPVSRERLNQAALAISEATGLVVDIVAGASGQTVAVLVPAGAFGRPELVVNEEWARPGVAYEIVDAVDEKSVALLLMILSVCGAVVANSTSAAVRTRRRELGILSGLGWARSKLFGAIEAEVMGIGLAAGLLGSLASWAISVIQGAPASATRLLLPVPAALALMGLAGLLPAWRASRTTPMNALRPQVLTVRRSRDPRSLLGFALRSIGRTPGRTVLGVAGLAIGVAALTFLLDVQTVFRGAVVGSLLGDAVAVNVRGTDLAAILMIGLLSVIGLLDVVYLAAREQAPSLAVLRAAGWAPSTIGRMVFYQGLALGFLGGVAGGACGWVGFAIFTGSWTLPGGLCALAGVGAGVMAGASASLVPSWLVARAPSASLLSEDE